MLPIRLRVDPGHNGKEDYTIFPEYLSEASLLDDFISYPGHSFEEFFSCTKMQSVYSTAPADWADKLFVLDKNT